MQQPELGLRLTALRKEKNLTQEELVEKSHVSVRTIQRIEAGEVLPRMSTVKILLEALGQSPESFLTKQTDTMETKTNSSQISGRTTLLIAVIAGAIYLVALIILGAMDVAWLTSEHDWEQWMNLIYISVTVVMLTAYVFFIRGFIVLSSVFENTLLKIGGYLMIGAMMGLSILDVSSLYADSDTLWINFSIPYAAASVLFGTLTIVFGIALIRLQDSMGELSRVAGMLEILIGCVLITVVLFFLSYVFIIPAVIVEILVLYRGYEYLSKSEGQVVV